jgi:hypothetical protein
LFVACALLLADSRNTREHCGERSMVVVVHSNPVFAVLSEEDAAPLKHLLGAKSKAIVDKIVCEVFKQLHAPLDKRVAIDQSLEQALSLATADAYAARDDDGERSVVSLSHTPFLHELSAALHLSLRLFVAAALRAEASDVLPASFHQALGTLLCDVVRAHASEWRDSAIVRQPSLPRLVDFDWRVDVKTASDSAAQMSVPTVLMRMTLAGSAPPSSSSTPAPAPGAPAGTETVTFELTRDALKTLLESMTKIRAQLQSISN